MANDKADKLKALKLTLDKLDKTYGKGTTLEFQPLQNHFLVPIFDLKVL